MQISNKTISYYIILISTIVFYISFNKNSMGTICMFLSCVILIINYRNRKIIETLPSLIMVIITVLMLLLSGRLGERGFNAPIGNQLKFIFIFCIQSFALIMRDLRQKQKKMILLVAYITITISCIISLFYVFTQDKYAIRYFESRGFFYVMDFDQSYAVPFAAVTIFILLLNSQDKERKYRYILLALLCLMIVFTYFSLYTTALLLLLLGMMLYVMLLMYRKSKKTFIMLFLGVGFVGIVCIIFNNQISDFLYKLTEDMNWLVQARVRSVIDQIFRTDHGNWYTTERRDELANYSLNTFKNHILFGVGYKGYGYGVIGCHQEWYDILGVFGLVGGIYILFMMLFNLSQNYLSIETQMDKDALMISTVMLIVLGFFNPCLSKQVLFLVFVIAPNLSSLKKSDNFKIY